MLFDLRALGYFVAAYEERSVTTAARRCFVAQPSISMAIKGLEDALDTVLFERSRQGLEPTPAGHRLFRAPAGCWRSRAPWCATFAMPRARRWACFCRTTCWWPRPRLCSHVAAALAPCHGPAHRRRGRRTAAPGGRALQAASDTFFPLWREPYVMLVPERHPLRFKKRFGVADLKGLPLIEWPHLPRMRHCWRSWACWWRACRRRCLRKAALPDLGGCVWRLATGRAPLG